MSRAEPDLSPTVADVLGQQDPEGPGHVSRAGAGLQCAQAGELSLRRLCCPGTGWVIKSECPQHKPVAGMGWQLLGLLQGNRASLNEDGTVAIERDI